MDLPWVAMPLEGRLTRAEDGAMTPRPHPTRTRAGRPPVRGLPLGRAGKVHERAFPHKEGQLAAGEWLIERLRPGARVLDVGCGTGIPTARQLADAGCDVTGIDASEGMLELARREVPGATFLRLDLAEVPEVGRSRGGFDAIVAFFSLLMLPRTKIPAALRRLHDRLEPGGDFFLRIAETHPRGLPNDPPHRPPRGSRGPGGGV